MGIVKQTFDHLKKPQCTETIKLSSTEEFLHTSLVAISCSFIYMAETSIKHGSKIQ